MAEPNATPSYSKKAQTADWHHDRISIFNCGNCDECDIIKYYH